MQRKGKIARLPIALRTELNQRLANNEDGAKLLNWLNAIPGVPAMLATDFAGEPITKQNLYEWRQGGFLEHFQLRLPFEKAALAPFVEVLFADGLAGKVIGEHGRDTGDGIEPVEEVSAVLIVGEASVEFIT